MARLRGAVFFSTPSTTNKPKSFHQSKAFWYFFGGIIVFGFYMTNLFVGVMFEAFLSYKNMDSKGILISQAERRWRDYERRLCQARLSVVRFSSSRVKNVASKSRA